MDTRDDHARAQEIRALDLAGDATADERAFLLAHSAACARCASVIDGMERALGVFRSVSVRSEPVLVAMTRQRMREHALRVREEQVRRRGLALSCLLATALTLTSGLAVWRALDELGWAGTAWVWASIVVVSWFLPGVLAFVAAWMAGAPMERRRALTQ
jgi:hypothetical protein